MLSRCLAGTNGVVDEIMKSRGGRKTAQMTC